MTAFADTRRGDNKMKQMTLEEISKAAASGAFQKIPVSREIYSDIRTPVETLKVLQGVSSHCYMLESVEDKKQWGRYTFLGYDPSLELTCVNGNLTITAAAAEMKKVEDIPESHEEQLPTGQIRLTAKTAHPGAVIKTLIEKNKKSEDRDTADLHRRPRRILLLRLHQVQRADLKAGRRRSGTFQRCRPDAVR